LSATSNINELFKMCFKLAKEYGIGMQTLIDLFM
jgi:hypothetical protein